jgi:8-oxo-dGTP diphosphatase
MTNILKAGLIPVRFDKTIDNFRIALVFRKAYKDLTFPKGNKQSQEHTLLTAHRELLEETGIEDSFSTYLGETSYVNSREKNARVKYWLGKAELFDGNKEQKMRDNDEILYYIYPTLDETQELLTYDIDKKLVDRIKVLLPMRFKPILIVLRHAEAEPKLDYDEERSDKYRKKKFEVDSTALEPIFCRQ